MDYDLERVTTEAGWRDYHLIRRRVLWDARGRQGYDEHHTDDRRASNHPLLLRLAGQAIGTIRLDDLGDRTGIVRLVSIALDRQRHGYGRVMSQMADDYAMRLGWMRLMVNAATEAIGFYVKMNWHPFVWNEAELRRSRIPGIQMTKILRIADQPHATTSSRLGIP